MNIDLRDRNTQIGIGLVAVGILALLGNMGWFTGFGRLVGLAMFVAAGAVVLRLYDQDPSRIWTLPVGFGLIGLGLAALDMPWGGGAFLGSIGLGFLAVYLTDRDRWWALIPGGVLLTLGLTATYDEWLRPGTDAGGTVFFLGLAATFAVLYLLPSVNQRWAIWPALGLAVVGVLTIGFRGGWVLPIVLIVVGAWLLSRQSRPAEVPPSRPEEGVGGGTPSPQGGAGGAAGGATGATGAPGATGAEGPTGTTGGVTSPVDPSVRTPSQTPGPAAVQPSPRPETPADAVRHETSAEDAQGKPAREIPPYGQEPADWAPTEPERSGAGTDTDRAEGETTSRSGEPPSDDSDDEDRRQG